MEIRNYGETHEDPVFATFDIYLPAFRMTLRRWKLRKTKRGTLFISGPVYAEEKKAPQSDMFTQGDKKIWTAYISFDPPRDEDFIRELKCLLNDFLPLQLQFPPHQAPKTQKA